MGNEMPKNVFSLDEAREKKGRDGQQDGQQENDLNFEGRKNSLISRTYNLFNQVHSNLDQLKQRAETFAEKLRSNPGLSKDPSQGDRFLQVIEKVASNFNDVELNAQSLNRSIFSSEHLELAEQEFDNLVEASLKMVTQWDNEMKTLERKLGIERDKTHDVFGMESASVLLALKSGSSNLARKFHGTENL